MQWSPRNRTGDEEDDKSVDSETENPQSDNNNNNCSSSNNNNNNNNNNNKELRKDKRDGSVDKNHIDEDETIVVDNISEPSIDAIFQRYLTIISLNHLKFQINPSTLFIHFHHPPFTSSR